MQVKDIMSESVHTISPSFSVKKAAEAILTQAAEQSGKEKPRKIS